MTPEQPTKEEAIQLMKAGLDMALTETAASYVIPVLWITARDGKPHILDNGSAFMLDCGQGPFLVTNNHVLEGYRVARETYRDTVCVLGDIRFDLQERLISGDCAWDIATFRITADEIDRLKTYAGGKFVLTGSQKSWPPSPPTIGRGVFFVGFPGDGRSLRPYRGDSLVDVNWRGYAALAVATSVSETDITLHFDHDAHVDIGRRPTAPQDGALGGCSGAPLLTFVEQNGVYSWRLGGVIYEAGGQFLKASLASCLNPDGTVNTFPDLMAYHR